MQNNTKNKIAAGKSVLGIELGSTRIKAVLIDDRHKPIASGSHSWENQYENGLWTYDMDKVWVGLQDAYRRMTTNVKKKYGVQLARVKGIGISAMMHGYLALDKKGALLTPFRTWRNTTTGEAAAELTERFRFNIPLRWSIAHLYQAILNNEEHVADIACLTTLAGYVHGKLTGEKVLGVGDASGVFPIDSSKNDYDHNMMQQFDALIKEYSFGWTLKDILPKVLVAGQSAGQLTPQGVGLLDPGGDLKHGISLCAPEGDAGTGMVATNSIDTRTGNISAGTSIFSMVVLETPLSKVYPEIDMVTTPTGRPVAMVHCNNGTSDLDAWIRLLNDFLRSIGHKIPMQKMYDIVYFSALQGDKDCGGILNYNYVSGEPLTGFEAGRPLLIRTPSSLFTFANLSRSLLFSILATLKIGMDTLTGQEHVKLDALVGHGGFFKSGDVGQRLMSAAFHVPVTVMENASEGGAWGIALLASYHVSKAPGEGLENFIENVFARVQSSGVAPESKDVEGFMKYMARYEKGLPIQRTAVDVLFD